MKQLTQKTTVHKIDGTTEVTYQTYLYAEGGYFTDLSGRYAGLVICLGTEDSADHYTEVQSDVRFLPPEDIPESLPDIEIWEEEDEDATEEDLYGALEELGVKEDA